MKILIQAIKVMGGFIAMLFLLAPLSVQAQNKVVVVPLFGNDGKPLKNIVTVAKSNGMFTDPVAAVNSITDASASNPYLVVIGPGIYTITSTLQMKEYVDIAGCGENVTTVTGALSTCSYVSSAIISGADHCALTSLNVENTGGSSYSIALYNRNASPVIRNLSATASGGTYNYCVYNYDSSSPTMTNVTATGSGGETSIGVYNKTWSWPTMAEVTATASGGTEFNYAIRNSSVSSPTMTNVTATASGGETSIGIYNWSSSRPVMIDVTATASGGSDNFGGFNSTSSPTMINVAVTASGGEHSYGLRNYNSSPVIRRSTLEGATYGLYSYNSSATVSQSTIKNGLSHGSGGTNTCVACDNGSGTALAANCTDPTP